MNDVSARDQAVRRLTNLTRAVTAAAIAGTGLVAVVAARSAPGHRSVHAAAAIGDTPAASAPPATDPLTADPPVTTTPTSLRPRSHRTSPAATASPAATSPSTTRPFVRVAPPVRTTVAPVVTSGAS